MHREKYTFTVPKKGENLSIIRLTTSAIAAKLPLDIEKIEDLKLCISELCNIIIKCSDKDRFNIEYYVEKDNLEIVLKNEEDFQHCNEEIELSKMILKALIEDIQYEDNYIRVRLGV